MVTTTQVLRRLRKLCQSFGGDLVKVDHEEWDSSIQAPFTGWDLGVDYQNKVIYYSDFCMPSRAETVATGIIHEMGHVFACNQEPEYATDEFDFLGWEWAVAKKIGLTQIAFCRGNDGYLITNNGDEIQELVTDTSRRRKFFASILMAAKSYELIVDGKPVTLR